MQTIDKEAERRRASEVMEKYFDTDIECAESAYDVLVDNDIDANMAWEIAIGMFPKE
jgi:hypothetical protein